jgi:hypothetical protein
MQVMKRILAIGYFIRSFRALMRFGELSRAPLKLLRFQVQGDVAECEWLARSADPWDAHLPSEVGEQHVSEQALQDAIVIRELLFSTLPGVDTAALRIFRHSRSGEPELIITGVVARENQAMRYLFSLAMRAKLLGLQFLLENGILMALCPEFLELKSVQRDTSRLEVGA